MSGSNKIILIENKWEDYEEPLEEKPTKISLINNRISIETYMKFFLKLEDGTKDANALQDQFHSKREHITSIIPFVELQEIHKVDPAGLTPDEVIYQNKYFIQINSSGGPFAVQCPTKKRYNEIVTELLDWYYGE